jgi:hypothetical protein
VPSQDIAHAIVDSMTRNKNNSDDDDNPLPCCHRGWICNLADDLPAPCEEVMRHAVDLLESISVSFMPPEAAAAPTSTPQAPHPHPQQPPCENNNDKPTKSWCRINARKTNYCPTTDCENNEDKPTESWC